MKITLFPLEKIIIDDKSLYLGANKDEIIRLLGEPEMIREQYGGGTWRHFYFNSDLAFDYNSEGRLEYIEFLGGHDGILKPYIYGVSAFDTEQKELVKILSENNNGDVDDSERCSYAFKGSSVSVWTEDDEEFWMTIGMGEKGYYC